MRISLPLLIVICQFAPRMNRTTQFSEPTSTDKNFYSQEFSHLRITW
jgi:hypothetical protein